MENISDLQLINAQQSLISPNHGQLVIEPLPPGYGMTIGTALRRILLSSLPGTAITTVKINDISHEFSTIDGVKEDLVDLILNLKGVRIKMLGEDKQTMTLSVTGPKAVTAGAFGKVADLEIANPDHYLASIDSKKSLKIEVTVERGYGYLPTEKRKSEKLPIGTIAIDSIFSPVMRVNVSTEHTRVGQMTNYDRLTLELVTDNTIDPIKAVRDSCQILIDHFTKLNSLLNAETASKTTKRSRKKGV